MEEVARLLRENIKAVGLGVGGGRLVGQWVACGLLCALAGGRSRSVGVNEEAEYPTEGANSISSPQNFSAPKERRGGGGEKKAADHRRGFVPQKGSETTPRVWGSLGRSWEDAM